MVVWGHALAALLFGTLAGLRLRGGGRGRAGVELAYVAALTLTALWALAIAGIHSDDVVVRVIEPVRDAAWLAVLYLALRRAGGSGITVAATYAVVAALCLATVTVVLAGDAGSGVASLRMMTAVAGLVLAHRLAVAVPVAHGALRLALVALAALWSADVLVYATALASGSWPGGAVALRGGIALAVAVALVVAGPLDGAWTLRPSRMVALRSVSLAAIATYVVGMVLVSGIAADVGGDYARLVQTAFVAGATATLIGLVASPTARAWVKVKVAKHLFDHRYDYRHEWLRFTATLGQADDAAAPLECRVVQALADLTDSPAGLLLVADGDTLHGVADWNWPEPAPVADARFAEHLATDRIVDLDALRQAGGDEAALVPAWVLARATAWAVVPLIHRGRLTGAVVLARPPVARQLDWEDFDLLRVAGRQGASYLAEARAAAALGEAQRFDEFNRRFAFIIHDVKNLVSQLGLVARNAERHADNPAFRADMVATLHDSCSRMSALLARLSQHSGTRADPPRPTPLAEVAARVVRRCGGNHPVTLAGDAVALVDPSRFEQIVSHLVQNAVEASAADAPVMVAFATDGDTASVTVTDAGCGMTPGFVRDELFRPFASSKRGGFGIGAFEARQLTEAMGGRIAVDSQPGRGTRFTLSFPAAHAWELAA